MASLSGKGSLAQLIKISKGTQKLGNSASGLFKTLRGK